MNGNKLKLCEILDFVMNNPGSAFFFSPNIYGDELSYLFLKPEKALSAYSKEDFSGVLESLDKEKDHPAFGYITYEAGYLLEEKLVGLIRENLSTPIARFYLFDKQDVIKLVSEDLSFEELSKRNFREEYSLSDFVLNTGKDTYITNIKKIREYIEKGETYQVNYTIKGRFDFSGNITSLFLSLVFNQSARYIAFIHDEENYIISISPELFFRAESGTLLCKPMKGTQARGINAESDKQNSDMLSASLKNQAENVMIVDLLRNDMGKVSRFGSVRVDKLFEIEKYESLFQMTSSISSVLKTNTTLSQIIKDLFPCGSITGAPKIRTMEIIRELESESRGIYTGAIGLMDEGKIIFNVPIRTLVISKETGKGEMGIGSGIVWDSSPEKEYEETMLKGNFLLKPDVPFQIFTTMLVENKEVFLFNYHAERLEKTAGYFLFRFDRDTFQKKVSGILENLDVKKSYRLKSTVDKWGNISFELSDFQIQSYGSGIDLIVSKEQISTQNKFQYFKTTNRSLYDSELKKAADKGFGEVLFINENGSAAEGSITNIFIRKKDIWLTPPVSSGILDGVYRSYLLDNNKGYIENELSLEDVKCADEIILTNALKGKIKVNSLVIE